ncbi:hypothetical protein [Chryseobacterium salviniae]|uniref:EF-hand domain-containing protein n=1 Tax=Chryseobacterium salviniae TaxID=3101750 RepID=A0ABU6HQY7_9FLAO|nr:hypothetical protein [Chryseobacterium sp. T9W2-O]MEC3875464.1 hypothetical protein [Chryseobacterium sp. T9W2-O]
MEAYLYKPEGGGLMITPKRDKIPRISKVELFYVDDSRGTTFSFMEKLRARAYAVNLFNKELVFTLWEDDAKGGGHSKSNTPIATQKTKVDHNGIAVTEFLLSKALMQKAMQGEADPKQLEFYVTVEYYSHKKHATDNVEVNNPFPQTPKSKTSSIPAKAKGSPAEQKPKSKKEEKGILESIADQFLELWDWSESKGTIQKDQPPTLPKPEGRSPAVVSEPKQENQKEDCICKRHNLIWGNKVSCEFRKKVVEICAELWGEGNKIKMANGLMAVMKVETAGSFKAHQIMGKPLQDVNSITKDDFWLIRKNKDGEITSKASRAVGLIQFTQAALEQIGEFTSGSGFDKLHEVKLRFAKMGEIAQLDKVKKYFEPSKDKIKSPEDIYLHVFAPNGVGKADTYVLYDKDVDGEKYRQNESVDKENNHDGKITRSEILGRYRISYGEGLPNNAVQFICKEEVKDESLAKDCVQIRIYYQDALIEKHIPKSIKAGYENKYEYIYIDKNDTEHKIGEYSHTNSKLVNLATFKAYKEGGVNIAIGIKGGQESKCYIKTLNFAALIGALAEIDASDLCITQFSTSDGGSPAPSVSHKEGVAGDLRYLSTHRDGRGTLLQDSHFDYERNVALTEALYKFGYGKDKFMLSENFNYNGKITRLPHTLHYARGRVRHHHHLHIQGLSANFKEIEE